MRSGESLFEPGTWRDSQFIRALLAGDTDAAQFNAWINQLQRQVSGSCASGPVLREVFDGLLGYGFPVDTIRSMCRRFPNLLCSSWQRIHGGPASPGLLLRLERYGFSRLELVEICSRLPAILSYSWVRTHGSQEEPGLLLSLERYGFLREHLRTMCIRFPALFSYSWERTHGNTASPGILLHLERYGFVRPQVTGMCLRFPSLLGYSWVRTCGSETQPGILLRLESHGLSRAGVIALCDAAPVVLGCRWERTASQLRTAKVFTLPHCPQLFLTAPAKVQWRWQYLTEEHGCAAVQARAAVFVPHESFMRRFGRDYEPKARRRTGEPRFPVGGKPIDNRPRST